MYSGGLGSFSQSALDLLRSNLLKGRLLTRILLRASTYIRARAEVTYALLTDSISSGEQCPDTLRPFLIPSVVHGNWTDRVVAEVDQDGYIFAADGRDAAFFGANESMYPRKCTGIRIILRGRRIYLRKIVTSSRFRSIERVILDSLRWDFYIEAAALLRLRGLNGVPLIRRIEGRNCAIEMDYIWGRDLRHILSAGSKIIYEDVHCSLKALLTTDNEISKQLSTILRGLVERGVSYRDLTAANLIVAEGSNRLYIIDFQDAHLS